MISNQKFAVVQSSGLEGLCLNMKPQLNALGAGKGDKVYVCVEESEGKKRIIIERVE